MRILVLSQWYRPEPEPKIHLLARDLVARGHTVTTITGIPNYPTGRIYPGYHLRPWPQVEIMDGVRVVRVPLYADHSRSAFKRILNYASFALSAAVLGPMFSGPVDVMWVYHPPITVGLPAWIIAAIRRVPFVFEVQDMWPEGLAASGMVRSGVLLRGVGRAASFLYRRAQRLIVISPGFQRNLVAKGVPAEKIDVIPNWADEDLYRPVARDAELALANGMGDRFNVVYAGNLGPAQGLRNLLEAAALLRDLEAVQFVIAGDGIQESDLRERAARENLRNVRFLGRIPTTDVPRLAALADVLLVHLKRDPILEMTIPSKTISSLACGRPILTVSTGDPAEVVRQAGAGLTCPPEEPRALAEAVRVMYNMPAEQREEFGRAARDYFLAHFTRAHLVPRYEELLREVAQGARR